MRANGVALGQGEETLAERLRDAGWDTAGFIGSFVITRRFGFDQGFGHWDEEFTREGSTSDAVLWEGHRIDGGFDRRGEVTTERALRWLEGRPGRGPFFAFVHYYDPHAPYDPPPGVPRFAPAEPGAGLSAEIAGYDAEIRYTDAQLGRLLDALDRLGLAGRTLVVVTADHGEGLMQHGLMGHGLHVYEEQVRVPLVLRLPGVIPAARVLDGPVEMVDLWPTLLELMGVGAPPGGGGRSLAEALRGGPLLPAEHPVYLYRRRFLGEKRGALRAEGEKFGVREGRLKYVVGPEEGSHELFDLEADPGEVENLFRPDRPEALRLAERIAAWRKAFETEGESPELTDEVRRGLEALGYVE